MKRPWTFVVTLAVSVLLVGSGVAFSRDTPEKTAKEAIKAKLDTLESSLVTRLAKELGVSEARLRAAMRAAGTSAIDDALKQGLITKEQASFLKGRLGAEGFGFDLGLGRFKHGFGEKGDRGWKHGHFAGLRELLSNERARTAIADAVARKLGMTRAQLATALDERKDRQGNQIDEKDLEDLAAAKHLSEADLGAVAAAAAKPYLDNLVKAGTLERASADALLSNLRRGAGLGKIVRLALFFNR